MALYTSEFAKFMSKELKKHPEWHEGQLIGRSLLWDRDIDQAELAKTQESSIAKKAYAYDDNF